MPGTRSTRLRAIAFCLLLVNSGYIAALPAATLFYMANVGLHLILGLALMALAAILFKRYPRECGAFLVAGLPALFLAVRGNTLAHRWALWLHILLAATAVLLIGLHLFQTPAERVWRAGFAAGAAVLVLLPAGAALYRAGRPDPNDSVVNPATAPLSMDEEGAGARSPFAPSSAQTNTGKIIPSNFFMALWGGGGGGG